MATKTKTNAAKTIVGEICLYGNRETGAGWLASAGPITAGKILGDGDPVRDRGFTEAVWQAADALRAAGVTAGIVRIFAAGGQRMAEVQIEKSIGYFGDLKWSPAIVYAISADAIAAAAE